MLIATWKEILNLDTVNIHDHFFDIGGNSLGLILINNRLNAYLDKSVPLVQLFEHSSIASLVNHLVAEQMLPTVTQQVQEESGHIASVGYPVTNPDPTTAPKEYVRSTVEHSKVSRADRNRVSRLLQNTVAEFLLRRISQSLAWQGIFPAQEILRSSGIT